MAGFGSNDDDDDDDDNDNDNDEALAASDDCDGNYCGPERRAGEGSSRADDASTGGAAADVVEHKATDATDGDDDDEEEEEGIAEIVIDSDVVYGGGGGGGAAKNGSRCPATGNGNVVDEEAPKPGGGPSSSSSSAAADGASATATTNLGGRSRRRRATMLAALGVLVVCAAVAAAGAVVGVSSLRSAKSAAASAAGNGGGGDGSSSSASASANVGGSSNGDGGGSNNMPPDGGGPPSQAPSSRRPTGFPSDAPSQVPTAAPSVPPTAAPSEAPTGMPSEAPSGAPTTSAPTLGPVEVNPVPPDPPRGYFNYDVDDARFGPHTWHRVDTSRHFLREFDNYRRGGFGPWEGFLEDLDPLENRCGGPDRKQSPKDLVETIPCEATHEIRTKCGSFPLSDPRYSFDILPHKLSITMPRRECLNDEVAECREGRPPSADYPRYSSSLTSYSDLHNFDVKVPGEHTLEGQTFDAEIQMLHTHLHSERISSIGIPVRATANGHNDEFQVILDRFQLVYDSNARSCAARTRNSTSTTDAASWGNNRSAQWGGRERDDPGPVRRRRRRRRRRLQTTTTTNLKFNPYSAAFMRTIFFYRYDGSITEPPCLPITWWVMNEPMLISTRQLEQVKLLLFTHVDGDCQPTSVHNADQSVARPIQPLGEQRDIQKCSTGDFRPDVEKGRPPGNQCRP